MNAYLPFVDFCPETVDTVYEVVAKDTVALRFWVPPSSPMFPVLKTLLKNSIYVPSFASSSNLPTSSSLNEVTIPSLSVFFSLELIGVFWKF